MRSPLAWVGDRLRTAFNPGEEALNVPPLEGPLKPNDVIEEAEVLATLPAADNAVLQGGVLYATSGAGLYRIEKGVAHEERRFEQGVSALAALGDGGLAVGLEDAGIVFHGGARDGTRLDNIGGARVICVTDLAEVGGALIVTEGSTEEPPARWLHDLMGKRSTGRVSRVDGTGATVLAAGLGWPSGACAAGSGVLVSLAWEHRMVTLPLAGGALLPAWSNMTGYAGRVRAASGGGYWLAVFALRTKLVEFVLQEDTYRRRMMQEIEPRYWVAPALAALDDHWEPLQGGGIKQLGIVKPWAPPRSYGLVARLNAKVEPVESLHSRFDKRRHGITSVVETPSGLVFTSKGNGLVLRARGHLTARDAA